MPLINRREMLGTGLALTASCLTTFNANAQSEQNETNSVAPRVKDKPNESNYGAANLGLGASKALAEFLSKVEYHNLSEKAIHEAKRATLDWLGCALIGSKHPTSQLLVNTFKSIGSYQSNSVIGHSGLKLSLLDAPVANGQMGHVLDFDDTHLGGVILHTSTATMPALLALGERNRSSGQNLITALATAFEAGIRTGQAMPNHHRGGWHLTGTLGTVAATAGSARLLGLDSQKMLMALGIGCTQAAGMQQNRGSDCKSLHAGKSAYHGVLAATLASNGFNSSPEILDGSLGFIRIYSTTQNISALTTGLGVKWMIEGNGYKPYSCGVVLHPLIDACIKLAHESKVPIAEIGSFEVLVNPDVIRITGVDQPGSGLMSKFSANHAAAAAYIDQAGGVLQFSNERSQDSKIQSLRKLIKVTPVSTLRLDQAIAKIQTKSGANFEAVIDHASGTIDNPMSDQDLEKKFVENAKTTISQTKIQRILTMVWALENLRDINALIRECA